MKRFQIDREPTDTDLGEGWFEFTDDYSIFDWGSMPDTIPGKGPSLCSMGAFNFEQLEEVGISTHYRGIDSDGSIDLLAAATDPPRRMAIELTQVPPLPRSGGSYDYERFHREAGRNYLIPLEIVFRNRVPIGSSLRRRTSPADHGLSFDTWPEEVIDLNTPIVEFSTKFEESDRYLDRVEAAEIAGEASLDELRSVATEVNDVVTQRADEVGFVHEDGKIECLYHDGEIKVADVVGTFDENRFSVDETQLSKETIRQYHKRHQPEWVDALQKAKVEASDTGISDWRTLCERDPEPLDGDVLELFGDIYRSGANTYLDRQLFDAPPLSEVIDAISNL